MTELTRIWEKLPGNLRREVLDFAEFLLTRSRKYSRKTPRLNWAGALREADSDLTSVELQHEIARWRTPDE